MQHIYTRRRSANVSQQLRNQAGRWLRALREKRGLSQRELARQVGADNHTFISQLEHGRCRIPPGRYLVWAHALGVGPRKFVRALLSYYDPVTYNIIFAVKKRQSRIKVMAHSGDHHDGMKDLRPEPLEPHPLEPIRGQEPKPASALSSQNGHLM
jgi:transcriptional regulator with XRE-family HTH domain